MPIWQVAFLSDNCLLFLKVELHCWRRLISRKATEATYEVYKLEHLYQVANLHNAL